MSNKSTGADPRIFIMAANDERLESENEWDVSWAIQLVKAHSRHVVGIRITVIDDNSDPVGHVVAKYEAFWPNATPCTWEAFLYQSYHKVARMVESWGGGARLVPLGVVDRA